MCFGGTATPTAPALPPAPPPPPTAADPRVGQARTRQRNRSLISTRSRTIATSTQGDLSDANTERKSLLGS